MKTIKKVMILLLGVTVIGLTGCSNDDNADGVGSGSAASGTLSANVGGTSYQSMEISSSATVADLGNSKSLVIIATNSDGNAFNMSVFGYTGPGTYKLTGADVIITNTASYTETNVDLNNPLNSTTEIWSAPYDATEVGTIIVTEETDSKIKGTFSFMCKNVNGDNSVKDITDGAFDLGKQTS